jgi:DNA-binding LacI/PurR family transcriptional regulator
MTSKVTISTVAQHARVSRQTVSNVLNAPHLVSDETRTRVRDAIEELGYRASQAARQMRTGRSGLVAVRIDPANNGIEGAVLDRFLHGLTEAATPAGYRVVLYTATDDQHEISVYDELLASYALDGFVLTHTHHGDVRTAWLREHTIPFVTFGRPWGDPAAHPWVDVDGAAGTAAATRHLLAAGHRRVGFIGWPSGSDVGDDRRKGWRTALVEAGVDPTGLDRETVDGTTLGERAAHDLLTAAHPPTAFVCASDPLALGALRALDGAAMADPHGFPVVGFDDTPMAFAVGLSSVRQPVVRAAAICVQLLARQLDSTDVSSEKSVLLPPELVIRPD